MKIKSTGLLDPEATIKLGLSDKLDAVDILVEWLEKDGYYSGENFLISMDDLKALIEAAKEKEVLNDQF